MMNDADIVKALECCRVFCDCSLCPYDEAIFDGESGCETKLHKDALDLITRQQAENERLEAKIKELKHEMSYMRNPNSIGDVHEMGAW
jgi:hypothetical protein